MSHETRIEGSGGWRLSGISSKRIAIFLFISFTHSICQVYAIICQGCRARKELLHGMQTAQSGKRKRLGAAIISRKFDKYECTDVRGAVSRVMKIAFVCV